ncbi:cytochrome P450 2D20-like [Mya arenaria]|uniref:cytochrome P450 2D20-like n=1 Tax=Mya arenaria TaxID=6604 RepID=UPI0022E3A143|nr:cytochrome P450 2D20-like [Mya arenaria]
MSVSHHSQQGSTINHICIPSFPAWFHIQPYLYPIIPGMVPHSTISVSHHSRHGSTFNHIYIPSYPARFHIQPYRFPIIPGMVPHSTIFVSHHARHGSTFNHICIPSYPARFHNQPYRYPIIPGMVPHSSISVSHHSQHGFTFNHIGIPSFLARFYNQPYLYPIIPGMVPHSTISVSHHSWHGFTFNHIGIPSFPALLHIQPYQYPIIPGMVPHSTISNGRKPGIRRGIVDQLLDSQEEDIKQGKSPLFTDESIHAAILETLNAGILTTWSVLSSTILMLLHYPEYQKRARTELCAAIGWDNVAHSDDRERCPLTEAIEMEAHRLVTVVPLLAPRECNKDLEFEGYYVPKKQQYVSKTYTSVCSVMYYWFSKVMGNVWFMHHDEVIWGDPWKFRPERFLDQDGQLLPRDHTLRMNWMPFGYGRRACLGEPFARVRYFLYMAHLLRCWEFISVPAKMGSCDPRNIEDFDNKITIRPKPFYCQIKRFNQI